MQSKIAQQLFEQSDPLRRAMIGLNMGFLGIDPEEQPDSTLQTSPQGRGGVSGIIGRSLQPQQTSEPVQPMSFGALDVSALPGFQTGKNILEKQAQRAKQSAIASGASGGALQDILSKGETDRARSLGVLGSELTQQQLNQALGLATGGISGAQTGLSSVMSAQAQQAAAEQQAKGAKGEGAGAMAAAAITKNPAAAAGSDRRIKTNIMPLAKIDGIQFYTYNYLTDSTPMAGVMAQEVEDIQNVVFEINGIKHVNYGELL